MASLYVTVVFTGAPVIVKASSLLSASAELLVSIIVDTCIAVPVRVVVGPALNTVM